MPCLFAARRPYPIRSTVIPINRRNQGRKWPQTKYRRQMKLCFWKRQYGQRWQIESANSQIKRLLGPSLHARSEEARVRECYLKVLTFDIMLLAVVNSRMSTEHSFL